MPKNLFRIFLKTITILVFAYMLLPVLSVVVLSFNDRAVGTFPMTGVTLKWFWAVFEDPGIVASLKVSFALGLVSASISTIIGTLAAYALARYRVPAGNLIQLLLVLPMLVPHLILGVGLLLAFRLLGLPKNFLLLVVGHVALTMPLVILMTRHRFASISPSFEEAARTLGANGLQTFRAITFPLALPAMLLAFLFTFMSSFDELTATLFWRPPNVETVTTQIMAMLQYGIDQRINALATILIAFSIGVPVLATLLVKFLGTGVPRIRQRYFSRVIPMDPPGGAPAEKGSVQ